MIPDDSYWVCFLTTDLFHEDVEPIVQQCLDIGFSLNLTQNQSEPIQLEDIIEGKSAHIHLQYDESTDVSIGLNFRTESTWNEPRLIVSFSLMPLSIRSDIAPEDYGRKQARERFGAIIHLIKRLVAFTDPEYAWGVLRVGPSPDEGLRPMSRPINENISKLDWITVLSESIIEDFGGRERVLKTPAWKADELDSGHILIVRTDHPTDPTEVPSVSINEYLLEDKSLKELRREQHAIVDPFVRLNDGDIGTDIVIRRENVAGDLTNDDLELVRCEVRDRALWDLETGAFVRRTLDGRGNPIGDLPDGVGPEDEPYPPLIRLNVPSTFVHLDSPDGETVVSKVMQFDIEVSKLELLSNFAANIEDEDDQEGLEVVTDLLDQLVRLEDVDGIERFVRRKML